jgi:nucleoid-associated protein YgaU
MKSHRKETMVIMAKYLKSDDADALQEAYESIGQALIPEKPYPTLKGIQTILRELGAKDPNARSARPEQFVDLSFIKELDSSGFIDRLQKQMAVAKAASRPEPAPAPVAAKEKSSGGEAKAKTVATEEKTKPVAKQVSTSTSADKTPPAQLASKPSAGAPSKAQEYTVKAGDTLSKLAEHFYNSMRKWEKIYEANRDVLKNPNYIYIGMKLTIPMEEPAS